MDAPPLDMKVLPACASDPNYVPNPATQIRYFASAITQPWQAASNDCDATGAHLVVIDDSAENLYVEALSGNIFWIGMNDLVTEGTFVWVTGALVDAGGFTSWRGGQPNNENGTQHCGEMDPNSSVTWNDFVCGVAQRYVCECPP
jgi:hypothetical protein